MHMPAKPTIFIVFGATGDIMTKKVVPSLYFLHRQKLLPKKFKVIGYSRRAYDDEAFREHVFTILKKKKFVTSKKNCAGFLNLFHFQQGTFNNRKEFNYLADHVASIKKEWKVCTNTLFYFAVPPRFFSDIIREMQRAHLSNPCDDKTGWARLMIEKPFGSDQATARKLEKLLVTFKQGQIYRIDHYNGKEMVQGILNFRFSNHLLEHEWNNKHIESIAMKLFETIGVEDRGTFYDSVGVLRDVGQNHMLSLLALLTMEHPRIMDAGAIRRSREAVLKQIKKPTVADIKKHSVRAQYDGYRKIEGVKKNSNIATYFKMQFESESLRWKDVPIVFESGKRMGKVKKEIVVTFKHARPCLCLPGKHFNNRIIFSLHPHQGITIEFWDKKPGFKQKIEKRTFDFFLYKNKSKFPYVEEYAKLIHDAIQGDQTWFVSKDEVDAMWAVTDPLERAWKKNKTQLYIYTPDTDEISLTGPKAHTEDVFPAVKREIGIVGLGKMGGGLAESLLEKDWQVTGYNRSPDVYAKLQRAGLITSESLADLVTKLAAPRLIWLMVPSGKPVDEVLFGKNGIAKHLAKGDVVIDGGNSFYKNTIKRAKRLKRKGIRFLDCGVSGGPDGARYGACLMVGGNKRDFEEYEELFYDLAQDNGYQFFDGVGAGHFVKMVHNGIEYGMMQSIAEGFSILKKTKYNLDLTRVADVYNNGSVIESRLVGWLKEAYELYGEDLGPVSGTVAHSGEGLWTVMIGESMGLSPKVIKKSLEFRVRSAKKPSYTGKVNSALRGQFGKHPVLLTKKR